VEKMKIHFNQTEIKRKNLLVWKNCVPNENLNKFHVKNVIHIKNKIY
jgi:hypothetical protein